MRQAWILGLFVALLLTACTGGGGQTVTGKEGLMVRFLDKLPDEQVYENSYVPFELLIENKGVYSLKEEAVAKLSFVYDPFYIELYNPDNQLADPPYPLSIPDLEGRSPAYPNGDYRTEQGMFHVLAVRGQRTKPTTEVTAKVCYPYKTLLTQEVCVDTSAYSANQRKQACTSKDISLTSQGAPVAVTKIEPQIVPIGNQYYKPQFRVSIENVGKGLLLSPVSDTDFSKACALQRLESANVGGVKIEASLGSTRLECSPEIVHLVDNKGFARCSASNENLASAVADNYLSTLFLSLTYVYVVSDTVELKIERTGVVQDIGIQGPNECKDKLDGTACFNNLMVCRGQECVSKCDYCKDLPGNEEICNDIGVGTSFSCSCTRDECDAVYSQDKCARKYYCPGNAYCCDIGERGIVLLLHMMQNGGVQWQNIASVSSKSLQAGVMYDFYGYARGTGITTCSIVIKRPDGTIVDQNGQLLHEYVCLDEQTAKDNKLTFTPELGRYVLEFTAATSSTPKYKRVTLVVT